MKLNMNNLAERSKMEKEQKEKQKSPELIVVEQELKLLKEQLSKRSDDQADLALQKEAEEMAKKEAALKTEADLKMALGTEFSTVKAGLKDGEEISPEQMIAIMGEAVEASSNAQGQLILNKVESMMLKSNDELQKTQKVLFELAAGVSMNQTRSEHPDYDDYKTEIAGIMSTTRGVSPGDAYLLAKAKKEKDQPKQQQTETERPDQAPTGTPPSSRNEYTQTRKEDDGVRQSPKAVFQAAAAAAIEKVLAARR